MVSTLLEQKLLIKRSIYTRTYIFQNTHTHTHIYIYIYNFMFLVLCFIIIIIIALTTYNIIERLYSFTRTGRCIVLQLLNNIKPKCTNKDQSLYIEII